MLEVVRGGASIAHRRDDGDTCYSCAVDEDGLAVSVIQSIYHDFRKRTFRTLTPAMLCEDGEPRLVYATMGGEG